MRMMIDLVETRFSVTCQGAHIPSHRGEPRNELVDALAKSAAFGHATHDLVSFFNHVMRKTFVEAGEWIWALFAVEYADMWQDAFLTIPAGPKTCPSPTVLAGVESDELVVAGTQGQLQLSLATGNVLTLKGSTGPTRQSTILQQLHEAGITIFALQETRLRKAHCLTDPNFLLFHSPATDAGHYGVLVGFNNQRPHGHWQDQDLGKTDVYFQRNHVCIIASDPRFLILRVRSPILQCILVAAHAPRTGATENEIEIWWRRLTETIPRKYCKWDRILLADANARIGTFPTSNVGNWQAEADTAKSEYFLQFLQDNNLWVPATFEEFQKGEEGAWRHNQGMWLRNDYVALPDAWTCQELTAYVSDRVDLSTVKEDHALAVVDLVTNIMPVPTRRTQHLSKRSEHDLINLQGIPNAQSFWMPWDVDVHTHAHELQKHLLKQIPKARREWQPLKTTMTADTWMLVKTKKFWRNQMWEATRIQRLTWLRLCFDAWRHPDTAISPLEIHSLQKQQDHLCATAYGQFRSVGRQVVQALRRDDAAFFDKLARQASELTHPNQAREFWRVIRRSLPKMRTRKQQVSPMQLENLEDQWHPYFQELEVGSTTTPAELVAECAEYQQRHANPLATCELHELPSRAQLVNAFRSTTPHKATGLDPLPSGMLHRFPVQMANVCWNLVLKIFAWQQEPIQAKGGVLAVIPKKHDTTRAAHFRGIMLLPSIYKRLHAVLREQVIHIIAPMKPAGQIGGFQGQQVQFGSMSLQCFSRIAQEHNLSMGVVFVDLANAFHRLIRELVCGISRHDDVEALLKSLDQHGCPTAGVSKWLEFPCLLQRLGAPERLVNLLRDVHTHTWHVLSAHLCLTRTRRGTRPGSPLADVFFHVAMLDVTIELNEWVAQQAQYQALLKTLGIHMEAIVWSDDLAMPWLTQAAEDMPEAIEKLLQQVHKVFQRRGFELNMQRGKTTAVVTFRGKGAPEMRRKYQLAAATGMQCQVRPGKFEWLHIVPAYKHLGTMFASDGSFQTEMRSRIGQAMATFAQLSRPVLCNRHIAVTTRLRLFHVFGRSLANAWTSTAWET